MADQYPPFDDEDLDLQDLFLQDALTTFISGIPSAENEQQVQDQVEEDPSQFSPPAQVAQDAQVAQFPEYQIDPEVLHPDFVEMDNLKKINALDAKLEAQQQQARDQAQQTRDMIQQMHQQNQDNMMRMMAMMQHHNTQTAPVSASLPPISAAQPPVSSSGAAPLPPAFVPQAPAAHLGPPSAAHYPGFVPAHGGAPQVSGFARGFGHPGPHFDQVAPHFLPSAPVSVPMASTPGLSAPSSVHRAAGFGPYRLGDTAPTQAPAGGRVASTKAKAKAARDIAKSKAKAAEKPPTKPRTKAVNKDTRKPLGLGVMPSLTAPADRNPPDLTEAQRMQLASVPVPSGMHADEHDGVMRVAQMSWQEPYRAKNQTRLSYIQPKPPVMSDQGAYARQRLPARPDFRNVANWYAQMDAGLQFLHNTRSLLDAQPPSKETGAAVKQKYRELLWMVPTHAEWNMISPDQREQMNIRITNVTATVAAYRPLTGAHGANYQVIKMDIWKDMETANREDKIWRAYFEQKNPQA